MVYTCQLTTYEAGRDATLPAFSQLEKKTIAISIRLENRLAVITTNGHMIHSTFVFYTDRSSHDGKLPYSLTQCKLKLKERADPAKPSCEAQGLRWLVCAVRGCAGWALPGHSASQLSLLHIHYK